MKKLRILVLMHEELVPPDGMKSPNRVEIADFKTEYDFVYTLRSMGHDVRALGVRYELLPIRRAVENWKPHVVFNLLEEFRDEATFDHHMVAYLELMSVAYTGCSPRGLVLARDKALSKKILTYHRIAVPRFVTLPRGRKVREHKRLAFPVIVKSINEEASRGIAQSSLVHSQEKLVERARFIHDRIKTDAIAEEFIAGRELYVSVLGNRRLEVLPVWELVFKKAPQNRPLIATEKAKWDLAYQKKWGVDHGPAKKLPEGVANKIVSVSKRIYRRLELTGYARLDYRLDQAGKLFFLEANPNPDIARDEEVAKSAKAAEIPYKRLLQKIIGLALRR